MRFYQRPDLSKINAHRFNFIIWRFSGKSRYYIHFIFIIAIATIMHIMVLDFLDL